jgi:5-methylcytosine-specific restriction endonuclease McrA
MSAAAFHVDHIIPKQHGSSDDPSNLALACYHYNLYKGPNLTGLDPDTEGDGLAVSPTLRI